MRNFVILIDTLSGGGAEQVMLRLATAFIEQGHQVKFIVVTPVISHRIPKNMELIFVHDEEHTRGFKLTYYKRTANKLQKILDKLNSFQPIDALLSNLPETDRITHYLHGFHIFHCIHNSFYHGQVKNKKGKLNHWIKKKKLQRLYNNKHLIFVSKAAENDLLKLVNVKPTSSTVLYNPFPIKEIQKLSLEHTVPYNNYFLHVGRFNRQKRHDKLLKIYAESGLTNTLILMGEGNTGEIVKIKQLISHYNLDNRVVISGFNQNPFPYMYHANSLLLTSDYEGLPTVVIESLICGTPTLCYDCPSGLNEILTESLQDYLIPFDNSILFTEKLKYLAKNPQRISTDKSFLDRFDAKNIATQYITKLTSQP
jgi:glycosyltransferase involved in cell wall biosynthesis